jgi:SNF family Na+-dependent transporter
MTGEGDMDQIPEADTGAKKAKTVEENKGMVDFMHSNGCVKAFRDEGEDEIKSDRTTNDRQLWAGACTFIMAAIGSAIGLGNFWKFPYLCYKWGGGTFFIPYLCALFVLGLPMMLLELGLGQLFQRGDIGVFRGITPRFYGVGLASVFSAFAINTFYTYLIGISAAYFFAAMNPIMPWSVMHSKAW